jgi:PST family polysaccharide transporter
VQKAALVRSGAVTITGQLASLVVTAGSTMVLARLLQPRDFGLLAMVYSLTSFIASFRDFGLPMAALQSRDMDDARASALFWINLRVTMGVTLFMLAMGPVLAWFYGERRLVLLTTVLTAGVFAAALANQHQALLTRRMRFGTLVALDFVALAAGSIVAIALALYGAGYWALAAQFIIWQTGRSAAIWILSGWRPSGFRAAAEVREQIRPMISFGAYLTGYRMLTHLGRDLDRIVVGYVSGPYTLGLYDSAFRWARMPLEQLYTPLLAVMVAGLSRAREDAKAYRRTAKAALLPVLTISLPAVVYVALESEPIVLVLLGPNWQPAIPLLRWLSIATVAIAVLKTTKWLYLSMGDTKRQLRWGLFSFPVKVAAIVMGASVSATGVAIGVAAANWLLVLPGLAYCLKGSPLRVRDYVRILGRPAFASCVAGSAVLAIAPGLPADHFVELLVTAVVFGLTYIAAWLLVPGGWSAAVDMATLVHQSTRRDDPRTSLHPAVEA